MECIFGIFDILGFTSFCENCDPHNAEKVFNIIDEFETDIPNAIWSDLDAHNTVPLEKKQLVTSRLCWLIFSDTVFVAMPIDLSDHPEDVRFNLLFFMILVAHINRRMFEIGLPVRGAVHKGDVILGKRCFAGKAIVEAYKLGKQMQVAGTVISEQANAFISSCFSASKGLIKDLIIECDVECDVSTGTTSSNKLKTLCWFYLQTGQADRFNIHKNLNHFITEKVTAHGKKLLHDREKNKVVNTEKRFTDWKIANYLDYQRTKNLLAHGQS